MQISGLRSTKLMTQPGSMRSQGMLGQKLVFIYPMLSYDTIDPKLQNTLRDFFATSMVSQIKESNMLNMTVDAIKNVGLIGSGSNAINPAELVRKSLWQNDSIGSNHQSTIDSWTNNAYREIYQQKINEFYNFIQNQINHDVRYVKLRPVLSNISAENLLQLPLVIGTKHYSINPIVLYYVLLTSAVFNIPIQSSNNVNAIFNIIERIPAENYINLIFDIKYRDQLLTDIGITRLDNTSFIKKAGSSLQDINNSRNADLNQYKPFFRKIVYKLNNQNHRKFVYLMNSEIQKAKIFFGIVLNESAWSIESNGIETRQGLTLNTVSINTPISSKYYSSAINSFSNYLRSVVIPIFNNIEIIFGPTPPEINVSVKIEAFLDKIFYDLEEDFKQLGASIVHYIRNENIVDVTVMKKNAKSVLEICEENSKMTEDIKRCFEKLESVSFITSDFNTSQISDFLKRVSETARILSSHEQIIDEWFNLMTVVNNDGNRDAVQINNLLHSITQYIRFIVDAILKRQFPENRAGNDIWLDVGAGIEVYERYADLAYTLQPPSTPKIRPGAPIPPTPMDYVRDIFSHTYTPERGEPTIQEKEQIRNFIIKEIQKLEHAIGDIIIFLLKWNFFSYMCEYIKEVDIDIEVQNRDALEFPNYCLILPTEIISGLHNVLTVKHFKDILQDENGVVDNINELNFTKAPVEINKLIEHLCRRLNIPNLIAVDNKAKKIFFKFMYMNKAINLSISSLEQYVQHQKDILILN